MLIRLAVASCLLLISPLSSLAADPTRWSTYRGNSEHTGLVDTHLHVPADAKPRWTRPLVPSGTSSPRIGLAIADQRVYVTSPARFATSNPIVAVSLVDGTSLWERNFPQVDSVNAPAVGEDGTIYLVTGKTIEAETGFFHGLNGATGDTVFTTSLPMQWQRLFAPTIFDSQIVTAGGMNVGLHAFSLDGNELYAVQGFGFDEWTPVPWRGYWIFLSDKLNIVDRMTGALLQSIPVPGYTWTGWSAKQTPIVLRDVAYFTQGGRLIAVNVPNGLTKFVRNASEYKAIYLGDQVSTDGDLLFFRADGRLLSVDQDGNVRDAYENVLDVAFGSSIIITRSHVFGSMPGGLVNMYDRRDCKIVQTFRGPSGQGLPEVAATALADGVLVVAYVGGQVSAFDVPFYTPTSIFLDGFDDEPPPRCSS